MLILLNICLTFLTVGIEPAPPVLLRLMPSLTAIGVDMLMQVVAPSLQNQPLRCQGDLQGVCSITKLNDLDRLTVELHNPSWQVASDIGEGLGITLPFAWLTAEAIWQPSWRSQTIDSVWYSIDSLAYAGLLSQLLKWLVLRPRPYVYREALTVASFHASLSFPSGHTTAVASGMTCWSRHVFKQYPQSHWRWAALGLSVAVVTVTAVGRVEAGMHFPTDVLAGALLGVGVGLLNHLGQP